MSALYRLAILCWRLWVSSRDLLLFASCASGGRDDARFCRRPYRKKRTICWMAFTILNGQGGVLGDPGVGLGKYLKERSMRVNAFYLSTRGRIPQSAGVVANLVVSSVIQQLGQGGKRTRKSPKRADVDAEARAVIISYRIRGVKPFQLLSDQCKKDAGRCGFMIPGRYASAGKWLSLCG
jgi:hypothetical protein